MGISSKLKKKWEDFSEKQVKELIKMSWEDNTSYEEIQRKFDLNQNQVEKFLRSVMSDKEYKRWKQRVLSKHGRKHQRRKIYQ